MEFFKCLYEKGIKKIVAVCNKIYDRSDWPENFIKMFTVTIFKENSHTQKYEDDRTISLIIYASKISSAKSTKRLILKL